MLSDVTRLSLGISTVGDVTSVVIPKNTIIPVKKTRKYSTTKDNVSSSRIEVYEGEKTRASVTINLLGSFYLDGFPPAPRRYPFYIRNVLKEEDVNSAISGATDLLDGDNDQDDVVMYENCLEELNNLFEN
ncbi:hypothetical protein Fmac_013344 [Flemingia macrophylla]|uniref:Uncharacterized protein n=1 Tax=Flemingia macrophylla TaxID=520843 RepID=A0ABD1MTT2_9FABA